MIQRIYWTAKTSSKPLSTAITVAMRSPSALSKFSILQIKTGRCQTGSDMFSKGDVADRGDRIQASQTEQAMLYARSGRARVR